MNEKTILSYSELNRLGRAQEISRENDGELLKKITSDVKKTMRKNNLVSLSAPGIGYNKRVFCIDFSDSEIKTFINPVIVNKTELKLAREVCSSLPDKEYIVPRHYEVDIIYETPTGKIKTNSFKDVAAYVVQHELDHLNGVTLEDIGLEVDSDFDEGTEEERQEIISMYIDSLGKRQKLLDDEIEEDEELSTVSTRLKFTEALASGKVTFENLEELTNKDEECTIVQKLN
jgi:peptide deformylase